MCLYLYIATFALLLSALYYSSQWDRSKLPLPPGPKKFPLVGNLFHIPSTFEWVTYMEWSKRYNSDILHLNVGGKSIIVLSSAESADDLLVKRAAIYSDRPRLPMVNELMSWSNGLAFMKYGDRWRTHRRLWHETFNPVAVQSFRPKLREASHDLLRRMVREPDGVLYHLRHMAAKIVMSVAYGINIHPSDDPYVTLADQAVHGLMTALVPGRFLVDAFPILKYVPAWFPGATFKRKAQEWSKLAHRMLEEPYAEAKHKIEMGTAPHSFVREALCSLEQSENMEYLEQAIQATARSMYTAGSGTTVSVLSTFILAMLSNPEAQKMAQLEIDTVVGQNRLPDFDDEPSLPYVSALMNEVLRWINPTPIAIPHFLASEDEYRGYRLPASSIVIANTHAILHDEVVYPEPHTFNPERYLLDGKLNPSVPSPDIVYGFGRRICPGRHMAASSVWITLVSILATLDITKAVGDDGQLLEPTCDYFAGVVVQPLPFQCSIKPRSKEALALIQGTAEDELLV
ncbi:cytochrome P450 [Mycena sp. CBHHK59/15]|nr:cytochrome P450 [Mycena sp. CBHHK59/15]